MYGGEGPFLELLQKNCPIFKEEYRPPPLVHESRLMTIVAAVGRHRGLQYPFARELFRNEEIGEIALDWWDSRMRPEPITAVPGVPSSTLVDSLSYYYHNLSLPHLRLPQIPIPHMPQMRIPQIQIPYFGPLKRSASATGNEFTHLEESIEGRDELDPQDAVECASSPDTDLARRDNIDEGIDSGSSPRDGRSPEPPMRDAHFSLSDMSDTDEAMGPTAYSASPPQSESALKEEDETNMEIDDGDGVFLSDLLPASMTVGSHLNVDGSDVTIPEPKGIVLILPGLTGDSSRNYVQGLVQVVEQIGYTAVVMNYRGATGNLKACFMAEVSDVAQVIRHIKQRYADVPLVAVGVSLGGILLTNYVARCGINNEDSLLLGVMTVSVAWNFFESAKELEQPLNYLLFNRMLTRTLTDAMEKHAEVLQNAYNLEGIKDIKSLREFDERFAAKMFGYSNHEEYYKHTTLHDKVCHIKTPLLAINAGDDMFSPYDAIPKDDAKKNPNVCIVVTSHGGHIGFMEGRNPFGTNYVERVFQQYAKALFDNHDKVIASPIPDEPPVPMTMPVAEDKEAMPAAVAGLDIAADLLPTEQ
ncbi:uncharacterized protein LOC129580935 isoform X2 [Paramacrobiotus metropolitanus]|nr:uncharacterized protein LOC129580935 isoform X2 [Paramacrobiotus metropolitanus]